MKKSMILHGKHRSSCCHSPQQIVRSRDGGFVSQNCEECGRPRTIKLTELPVVTCECGEVMHAGFHEHNYAYRCSVCHAICRLCDLVPRWQECYQYRGLAIGNENEF